MNAMDTAADALEKLKIHEQAIGRLYKTYAERFGEQAEFWLQLSQEEDCHAQWMEMLQAEMRDDPRSFVSNRFPLAAIERSIAFVERLILESARPDFTSLNAISAAVNLEQALLENKYFEVFETDKPKAKQLLGRLQDETRAHHAMAQQVWQEARQSVGEPA